MPNTGAKQTLAAARELLARPIGFADFLAKLPAKDKVNAERRVAVLEAGPDPSLAALWRRLACTLMTLAPHAAKFVGKQTAQFYVADGKYRMQVFALEDLQDGVMTIYSTDALAEAVKVGLLAQSGPEGSHAYVIQATGEPLRVEILDSSSLNPGAHFKDMTGWNRKALRISLPPTSSPTQIEAAETLCALAASRFVSRPAPAGPQHGRRS
jgi:hypothetical protein